MSINPPTLLELSARTVRYTSLEYGPEDLPKQLIDYLNCAHCCVNPNCKGMQDVFLFCKKYYNFIGDIFKPNHLNLLNICLYILKKCSKKNCYHSGNVFKKKINLCMHKHLFIAR